MLLLATIIDVALLQRRLTSLRADREAVDTVVDRMNEATRRAEASLKGIRQTAEQARATLDDPMTRSQALRDELSFLVQRADAAGERVASGLSGAGTNAAAPAAPRPRPAARTGKTSAERSSNGGDRRGDEELDDVRSQAERDLMDALRNAR